MKTAETQENERLAWKLKRGTADSGWYYLKPGDTVLDLDEFMSSTCDHTWIQVTGGYELHWGFLGTYRRKVQP